MERCATCKHWEKWPAARPEHGNCSRHVTTVIDDDAMPAAGELMARGFDDEPVIVTGCDFGCTLHEPKEQS